MISCGEGKNTPRNWQLNTYSLHFYISLQLWRMHLCVPVIVLQHGGRRRHTRFYPFFHFYFFIFYNHLAILDYEAHPISSCIPLFILYTQPSFGVWRIGREAICTANEKNISERNSLYSPRMADHVLLVWTTGQAVGKRKKVPGPSLFLYLVWRTRALIRPDTTIFYSNKEGWRHRRTSYNILEQEGGEANKETGWDGLDWIGVGHFGNGRGSLVL